VRRARSSLVLLVRALSMRVVVPLLLLVVVVAAGEEPVWSGSMSQWAVRGLLKYVKRR